MTENLSILVVEDHEDYRDKITRILHNIPSYTLALYYAGSHKELSEKLKEGHYDMALVDFDLGSCEECLTGIGIWKKDGIHSAMIINDSQPGCIRIGISMVWKYATHENDRLMLKIYREVLDRDDLNVKNLKRIFDKYFIQNEA